MTKQTISDDSKIQMSIKGLWWIISSIFVFGIFVTTFQLNIDYKISALSNENAMQHKEILTRMSEIEAKQIYFVLRGRLENVLVFTYRNINTNALTLHEEVEFRENVRNMLRADDMK